MAEIEYEASATSDRPKRVLVVIPTLNEARTIETVVASLRLDPPGDASLRFVVADGGSTDGTQRIVDRLAAEHDDVAFLDNPQRLQSAAVNLAVERFGAEADFVLRCDAHATYPAGFARQLLETQDTTGADSVVVPMDSVGSTCFQNAVAWVSDTLVGSGGSAHRGGRNSGFVDHGHHALMRVGRFRQVGGYEESFSHNEDAEFDCRLRALGGTIFLDSDTRLEYHPRASFTRLWRQYFGYGKGRSRTVRRHPASLRLRQFAVPGFLSACLLCLLLAPTIPAALLLPLFYVALLGATSLQVAARHRSACGLLAGPVAGTMHVAWAAGFFTGLLTVREKRWRPDVRQASVAKTA